jgi:hypothetical protein
VQEWTDYSGMGGAGDGNGPLWRIKDNNTFFFLSSAAEGRGGQSSGQTKWANSHSNQPVNQEEKAAKRGLGWAAHYNKMA